MSLAYPLVPHHATHPEHLLALARWQGVAVPALQGLRVLELGCAAGANLLPMVARIAGLRAVGVDLALHEIARGRAFAAAAGVQIDLRCADVSEVRFDEPFDLIVAHGLVSWVPEAVADAVFALIGQSLAPGGVAYLSTNVSEGWKLRGQLRDWLLARVDPAATEAERVNQARAALPDAPEAFAALIRPLHDQPDGYIAQDYLAAVNRPSAFPALAAAAARVGLLSLGEVNGLSVPIGGPWLPSVQAAVAAVGADPVAIEDHLDRAEARSFRSTAFARADAPRGPVGPEGLFFTTDLRVDQGRLDADGPVTLTHAWGARTTLADPSVKRLLACLITAWPTAVPFAALRAIAGPHTVPILSVLCGNNLVHPRLGGGEPRLAALRPRVPADVRALVAGGAEWAADAHHRGHRLDRADQALLPLLDGRRTPGELARTLRWSKTKLDRELASAWDRGLRDA